MAKGRVVAGVGARGIAHGMSLGWKSETMTRAHCSLSGWDGWAIESGDLSESFWEMYGVLAQVSNVGVAGMKDDRRMGSEEQGAKGRADGVMVEIEVVGRAGRISPACLEGKG